MWPLSCTLCPGSGHSPDFPKWISATSGLQAVLLLFLPWLTELCSCPRLDLPGCYHRSPEENLPAPTSSAGDISPDACGTSLQHALHVPIPRSPSHPPSTGRILLPISHQLITEQWPSLNSEADGFKFTLAALSQIRVPRTWRIRCGSQIPVLSTANWPGTQCLNSNVPLIWEAIPHPGSVWLPGCCRCSDEKLSTHFSAEQPRECVSWMEAAA